MAVVSLTFAIFLAAVFLADFKSDFITVISSPIAEQNVTLRSERYLPSSIPIFPWDCCCHVPWSIWKPWAITGSWCCAVPVLFRFKCFNKCFEAGDIDFLGDGRERCGSDLRNPTPPVYPPPPQPPTTPAPIGPICKQYDEEKCCYFDMTGMELCNDPGLDKTIPPCCWKGGSEFCCGMGCMCSGDDKRAAFG